MARAPTPATRRAAPCGVPADHRARGRARRARVARERQAGPGTHASSTSAMLQRPSSTSPGSPARFTASCSTKAPPQPASSVSRVAWSARSFPLTGRLWTSPARRRRSRHRQRRGGRARRTGAADRAPAGRAGQPGAAARRPERRHRSRGRPRAGEPPRAGPAHVHRVLRDRASGPRQRGGHPDAVQHGAGWQECAAGVSRRRSRPNRPVRPGRHVLQPGRGKHVHLAAPGERRGLRRLRGALHGRGRAAPAWGSA